MKKPSDDKIIKIAKELMMLDLTHHSTELEMLLDEENTDSLYEKMLKLVKVFDNGIKIINKIK